MIPVIKGSSFLFSSTVSGLVGSHLSDDNVTITAEFYISGKYPADEESEYSKVTVEKSAMTFDTSEGATDTFTCYVDTTTLALGTLATVLKISYPSPSDDKVTIHETIQASFADKVSITEIK